MSWQVLAGQIAVCLLTRSPEVIEVPTARARALE